MKQYERQIIALVAVTLIPCDSFITPRTTLTKFSVDMAKDSDRARQERDFEDMMGEDWRVFRARLIAHEQEEVSNTIKFDHHVEVKKQSRLANFIASIFSPSRNKELEEKADISIFDGDTIGGLLTTDDPFATDEEKVAMNCRKVNFDRRRWAHPISHVETGCVLVANEKLGGVFRQTVVLIVNHNENAGSTGVCINKPLPGNLLKVGSETASNIDLSLKLAFTEASVSYGGPVMQSDYSILHGYGEVEGSKKVAPGIFVGGSNELIKCVRRNNFNPSDALFIKGHAAWIPSQLSREVAKDVWYIASVSPDFILRYARKANDEVGDNDNDLWSDILISMGGKYADVAKRNGWKDDKRMMP